MSSSDPHQQSLQQLTEAMLANRWHACSAQEGGDNLTSCRPPSSRLVRELLELVRTADGTTVAELKPMIRRLMLDRDFVDEPGTTASRSRLHRNFEHNLGIMIDVLDEVQRIACQRGEWPQKGQPATIPMVG